MTPFHQWIVPFLLSGASAWAGQTEHAWSWDREDTRLALRNDGDIVWRLNFGPDQPKPNFHPLATTGGQTLTAYEPDDHPWHRGLWWAWKYINGVNYWEENRETRASPGRTTVTKATIETGDDFRARATLNIDYHPPGQPALLTEVRHLTINPPDASGGYTIDWSSRFTAGDAVVTLDRTPPPAAGGPRHGGYAGLSLRFSKEFEEMTCLTNTGETQATEAHSSPARWLAFSTESASAAILDHPENLRHPQPWYVWNTTHMRFFSPSPIFDTPLGLDPGESFHLRYRILIQSTPAAPESLENAWKTFQSTQFPNP